MSWWGWIAIVMALHQTVWGIRHLHHEAKVADVWMAVVTLMVFWSAW